MSIAYHIKQILNNKNNIPNQVMCSEYEVCNLYLCEFSDKNQATLYFKEGKKKVNRYWRCHIQPLHSQRAPVCCVYVWF